LMQGVIKNECVEGPKGQNIVYCN
ncbi:hypothetical protein LCGC14_2702540, partial [marine sediment metagenome]